MNLLLIDNSNIFIGAKKRHKRGAIRFDYLCFEKYLVIKAPFKKIIVGSMASNNSDFWDFMQSKGYEVYAYEKNQNGEKAVDTKIVQRGTELICSASQGG